MGDVAALGVLRTDLNPAVLWPPLRARRCLFGTPNHDRTQTILENETKRLHEENCARWNFDFAEGKPLKCGRYLWTPVNDANSEKNGHNSLAEKSEQQTHITDFMRKRKMSTNQKETPDEPPSKTRRRFST